jgi:hypothetical protein
MTFVVVLAVSGSPALAASSDTVNITVTISQAIGVEITETSYNFGTLTTGTTATSASSLTVTNTGSGANENYSLNCSNTANWTAGTSPGTNIFVLRAQFNSTAPTTFDTTDILSTSPVLADATHFSGNETGINVPYGAVRHLWLRLQTPTSSSSTAQQTIVLTITGSIS